MTWNRRNLGFALAAGATALFLAAPPADAQKAEPFGQEKVETRPFRSTEVEKALNARQGSHAGHSHGKKGRKGRRH